MATAGIEPPSDTDAPLVRSRANQARRPRAAPTHHLIAVSTGGGGFLAAALGSPAMSDRWTQELVRAFRVEPGREVELARDFDPSWKNDLSKEDGTQLLEQGIEELEELQARL